MPDRIKVMLCDDIARITLNRPRRFNAFDLDTMADLEEHIVSLAVDETIRAVIITGEGKAFCAGGDLRWVNDWPEGAPHAFHNLAARYHQTILEIRRMPKPVIAAINGPAAGGGFSLALACDFRVMAESATFRQAYTSNGLSIDGGGTFTIPRIVGLARALEIAAFDEPISASKALEWGLVTTVVPDEQVVDAAEELSKRMASIAPNSFARAKQLFNDSFSNPFEAQLELERTALREAAAHPQGQEGIQAFLEKRKPVFHMPRW
jgi:2-(1,2-epoxy-1,2-dihydrophenyl)acetyl-CoA isomerase